MRTLRDLRTDCMMVDPTSATPYGCELFCRAVLIAQWTVTVETRVRGRLAQDGYLDVFVQDAAGVHHARALISTGEGEGRTRSRARWGLPADLSSSNLWSLNGPSAAYFAPRSAELFRHATVAAISAVAQLADAEGLWVTFFNDIRREPDIRPVLTRLGFVARNPKHMSLLSRNPRGREAPISPDATLDGVTIG